MGRREGGVELEEAALRVRADEHRAVGGRDEEVAVVRREGQPQTRPVVADVEDVDEGEVVGPAHVDAARRARAREDRGRVDRERRVGPVDGDAPVWNSNLQPDFNVRICDSFDASSSAVLRELDESNRFVQKSAESTSI